MTRRGSWDEGRWTAPPVEARTEGDDLLVTAEEGSDAWRVTSYGFIHDNEHALLLPLPPDTAVEVDFDVTMSEQFDQAGLFLRSSTTRWAKAGIEFADGVANLGAVVTDERSDWSSAPMPHWAGRRATVRASRSGDAVTVRAGVDDAVMLDIYGFVSETNATNIFIVKRGQLLTPHADSCLPGITRRVVMQLAQANAIPLQERNISISELYSADEIFTTGTMGELAPVLAVDGRTIGDGGAGPLTRRLQQLYQERTAHEGEVLPF